MLPVVLNHLAHLAQALKESRNYIYFSDANTPKSLQLPCFGNRRKVEYIVFNSNALLKFSAFGINHDSLRKREIIRDKTHIYVARAIHYQKRCYSPYRLHSNAARLTNAASSQFWQMHSAEYECVCIGEEQIVCEK